MIKAINIHKSYEGLDVLKGVSLNIKEGEIVSIVGSSGAGKSTLLQILGTLAKAEQGSLHINGKAIDNMNTSSLSSFRNEEIGFIFQAHHLLPEFTALENVCMPSWIKGTPRKETEILATELLNNLGLADRVQHKPMELSGGEQQRVAIARAFACEAEVLFCDEPTGNLDSNNSAMIADLIFNTFEESSSALVVVTHDLSLASRCDHKIELFDGKIL